MGATNFTNGSEASFSSESPERIFSKIRNFFWLLMTELNSVFPIAFFEFRLAESFSTIPVLSGNQASAYSLQNSKLDTVTTTHRAGLIH